MTDAPYSAPASAPSTVELLASEVQSSGAVFCPNPKMPLWSNHPRVFLDIGTTGHTKCPYCGTEYQLKPGETLRGHH
jgi:uncharacterized Zn-finger protein